MFEEEVPSHYSAMNLTQQEGSPSTMNYHLSRIFSVFHKAHAGFRFLKYLSMLFVRRSASFANAGKDPFENKMHLKLSS